MRQPARGIRQSALKSNLLEILLKGISHLLRCLAQDFYSLPLFAILRTFLPEAHLRDLAHALTYSTPTLLTRFFACLKKIVWRCLLFFIFPFFAYSSHKIFSFYFLKSILFNIPDIR